MLNDVERSIELISQSNLQNCNHTKIDNSVITPDAKLGDYIQFIFSFLRKQNKRFVGQYVNLLPVRMLNWQIGILWLQRDAL